MTEKDGFDAIEYPLDFAFKAVCQADAAATEEGLQNQLREAVAAIVGANAVKGCSSKASSAGKYISITTTARLENRQQLEGVYRAISALPIVKMTL